MDEAAASSLPDSQSPGGPASIEWLVPNEVGDDTRSAVLDLLAAHGYRALHSIPSLAGEISGRDALLFLGDPVLLPEVSAREASVLLWKAGIPFGVEGGNALGLVVPRRLLGEVRGILVALVPQESLDHARDY
jgi:hypothetical protein